MTSKPTVYTVTVSALALHQLDEACAYIHAQGSPLAAQRLATRFLEAIETLESHPQRGRSAPGGLHELVVVQPYVIRYRVRANTVEVVRIRHTAQRPT
ncbi:type II toxin-antitoxin system RelE/ParE family toxin [Caulobacter sp.]|jgi:toxin ParE1/3/4|uniref:type II toxin-antitoxin system RelE/ParE family toxin n=1 Tax=Caulobacter sp. TaxID=78 RepID=UPI0016163566